MSASGARELNARRRGVKIFMSGVTDTDGMRQRYDEKFADEYTHAVGVRASCRRKKMQQGRCNRAFDAARAVADRLKRKNTRALATRLRFAKETAERRIATCRNNVKELANLKGDEKRCRTPTVATIWVFHDEGENVLTAAMFSAPAPFAKRWHRC